MKIILTTSMSGLGGTEHASFRLGTLLSRHGHKIVLASSDGPLVPDAVAQGIWPPKGGPQWLTNDMASLIALPTKNSPLQ